MCFFDNQIKLKKNIRCVLVWFVKYFMAYSTKKHYIFNVRFRSTLYRTCCIEKWTELSFSHPSTYSSIYYINNRKRKKKKEAKAVKFVIVSEVFTYTTYIYNIIILYIYTHITSYFMLYKKKKKLFFLIEIEKQKTIYLYTYTYWDFWQV